MKKIAICIVAMCMGFVFAHEFVVEAPAKKQSASRLKESIAQKQADLLEHCSRTIKECAEIQERVIRDARQLLDQNKRTVFGSKDCERLEQYEFFLDSCLSTCNRVHQEYARTLARRESAVA